MWGNQNNGINLYLCEEIKVKRSGYIKVYILFLKPYHTNGKRIESTLNLVFLTIINALVCTHIDILKQHSVCC